MNSPRCAGCGAILCFRSFSHRIAILWRTAPVVLSRGQTGSEAAKTVLIRTSSESQFDRVSRGDGAAGAGGRGPGLVDPRSYGLIFSAYYGRTDKTFRLSFD